MRSSIFLCLAPVALCAAASPSPANVTISNATTENMTCSAGICSPTATDAVLNVQTLEAMLASGNATVTTTGSGVQAANLHVNARLTWSAGTTLSLDAFRSIEANAKVVVDGPGGVSLTTNDGGSGGDFACKGYGAITFANMSSALTINGTGYTLVDSVASLAGAVAAHPSRAFALAKDYNAKKDGTYTSSPIATELAGSFNGLGNAIFNLSITGNGSLGLLAETGYGSAVANIRLINENVQSLDSDAGGLVASSTGAISYSFTSGAVSGADTVGGLVGLGRSIKGSGSTATVSGGGIVGGLAGQGGPIIDSWATGNVSGSDYVGGLVGILGVSDIEHSWASGQVSTPNGATTAAAGGLVGLISLFGSIDRSHASGGVTCQYQCGGLLGTFDASDGESISQSYATGTVTSLGTANRASAGGLVGNGDWCDGCEILNSYASGAVSGWNAGGLAGQNGINAPHHSISSSYATGAVSGANLTGGLLGYDGESPHSMIKHAYWDTTTSGITDGNEGAGYPTNDPGITGLSEKKLKSGLPRGFDPKIWKEDPEINGGLPFLIANPPPLN